MSERGRASFSVADAPGPFAVLAPWLAPLLPLSASPAVAAPVPATALLADVPDSGLLARSLGYLVGAGSLLLYTPIAIRVCRQRDASGLTLSTWWLKLFSYTCSVVYSFSKSYAISTYIETVIVAVEAATVLAIVAFYQRRLDAQFAGVALGYLAAVAWALTAAPPVAIALGQSAATLLNSGALLPQLVQNARLRSPGGYSPLTASLACAGCLIRLFTTVAPSPATHSILASRKAGGSVFQAFF